MHIYLLDINKEMTDAWYKYFDSSNVTIVNEDFATFMNKHADIDAIVSPANSFGFMDGGYDKAIIDYLGEQAQTNVLTMLDAVYNGYQPIGTCLSIPFDKYIILHTPTMRTPEAIVDNRVIFDCMRSCLLEASKQNCKSIVIPAFGGCCGRVPYDTIARMMSLAYNQICNQPKELNWGYALYIAKELRL
jgi:O-acetyl-ADP-ribose deacetylase (regulator of RNase III)